MTISRHDLDAGLVDFSDIAEPGAPASSPFIPVRRCGPSGWSRSAFPPIAWPWRSDELGSTPGRRSEFIGFAENGWRQ